MTNLWVNVEDLGSYAESDYAYDSVKTASFLLWALSGRKFNGTNTVTERYISKYDPYLFRGAAMKTYAPQLIQGQVYNFPVSRGGLSGSDLMNDGSSSLNRIRLRGRKVTKVHAVRNLRGEVIASNMYYLAEHATLCAAIGASWVTAPVDVTYTYGNPPPAAGRNAARLLATELVKMYEGEDCALPHRVTSITRQGVTFTLLDDQAFIDELKTGLYAIDLFLKAVNPDKARARARVFSADTPRGRRITGQPMTFPSTSADLLVNADGGTTVLYLTEVGGTFLVGDPTWALSASIANRLNNRSASLVTSPVLDETDGTITVAATYSEILAVLGNIDPGTIDVIASRPSTGDPAIMETVVLSSSNAAIQMGSPVTGITTA